MKWFRFYAEALDDPKVQRLPPPLFKAWVNLLCLAAQDDDGHLPSMDDIAFRLRISEAEAGELVAQLCALKLLDVVTKGHLMPHNWHNRQQKSDDVTARVRSHRQRKAASHQAPQDAQQDVTLHETATKRFSNALDKNREEKKRGDGSAREVVTLHDDDESPPPPPPDPAPPTPIEDPVVQQVVPILKTIPADRRLLGQVITKHRKRGLSADDIRLEAEKLASKAAGKPIRAGHFDRWLAKASPGTTALSRSPPSPSAHPQHMMVTAEQVNPFRVPKEPA